MCRLERRLGQLDQACRLRLERQLMLRPLPPAPGLATSLDHSRFQGIILLRSILLMRLSLCCLAVLVQAQRSLEGNPLSLFLRRDL